MRGSIYPATICENSVSPDITNRKSFITLELKGTYYTCFWHHQNLSNFHPPFSDPPFLSVEHPTISYRGARINMPPPPLFSSSSKKPAPSTHPRLDSVPKHHSKKAPRRLFSIGVTNFITPPDFTVDATLKQYASDFKVTEISLAGQTCPVAFPFVSFSEECPEDKGGGVLGSVRLGGGDWEWNDDEVRLLKGEESMRGG